MFKKIKQNNNKELYGMAKYSGKDSDYLINQKYSMHFINHSKVNKFLFILVCLRGKKEIKNGDLDYLKRSRSDRIYLSNFYHWNQKEYLASEIFDLTEEEKEKLIIK